MTESQHVWYFAYGSNLDQDRFRSRVGSFAEFRRAALVGYRLRFSGEVTSEGGGGAIIVPAEHAAVHGVVYRITAEQMAAMDREEFDPDRDITSVGERRTETVEVEGEQLEAEVYAIRSCEVFRAPSDPYLGHILRGLRQAGYGEDVLDSVEAAAVAEPAD